MFILVTLETTRTCLCKWICWNNFPHSCSWASTLLYRISVPLQGHTLHCSKNCIIFVKMEWLCGPEVHYQCISKWRKDGECRERETHPYKHHPLCKSKKRTLVLRTWTLFRRLARQKRMENIHGRMGSLAPPALGGGEDRPPQPGRGGSAPISHTKSGNFYIYIIITSDR